MRVHASVIISMSAKCERLLRSTRAVGDQLPINEMNFNILLGLIEFFFWGLGGGSRAGFVKNMKL